MGEKHIRFPYVYIITYSEEKVKFGADFEKFISWIFVSRGRRLILALVQIYQNPTPYFVHFAI